MEGDKIIVKKYLDGVAVFKRVANGNKSVSKIDPHSAYEEELDETRYLEALQETSELSSSYKHSRYK